MGSETTFAKQPCANGEAEEVVSDPTLVFVRICHIDDIPPLGSRVVHRAVDRGGNIALFRTAADRVFALRDRCPHKGGPLSQGIVFGDRVACPLHNWTIELESGSAVGPDHGCTRAFTVRTDDEGVVYIALCETD